ncbi:McrB family protein [Bacillus velezensis]|uniref:McrB family protein n=1 Tax=Bacillus velezensis TaxID=492670 RepID=UPI003F7C21A1
MNTLTSVEHKILGNYYLGRLAFPGEMKSSQDPIYEGGSGNRYKVNIKILSQVPEELELEMSKLGNIVKSLDARLRPVYSNPASKYGTMSRDDKRRQLYEDFKKSLVIFKLEYNDGYYNVIDPIFTAKDKDFSANQEFDTIPYFNIPNVDTFIDMLKQDSKISELRRFMVNKRFDSQMFDNNQTPPYIILQESEERVFAYGPLNSITNVDESSIYLSFSNEANKIIIEDNEFLYSNYGNVENIEENLDNLTCYFIEKIASNNIRETLKKNEKKIADEKKKDVSLIIDKAQEKHINQTEKGQAHQIEQKILERFRMISESHGLFYTNEDLYNFHTSMKTGNLVILAGMSGTGKSKIVNCYAEALGLEEDRGTYKKIPVRPFWQDDSDLLGYLDALNNIYRPGDSGLIDFLIKANKEENKGQLHIVCFDEMNLARVEHYFSQFLSVLEEESEDQRKITLYNNDYRNRLYNSREYTDTVKIGDNVLFVGTVNLDESTFHFSDKVLDRANVIHLNLRPFKEVARSAENTGVTDSIGSAAFTKEQFFGTRPSTMDENKFLLHNEELDFLWDVHKLLQNTNHKLGIGFRIVRQIDHYLQCLPNNEVITREKAVDLQILQRVLTKIRGGEDQLLPLVGEYEERTKLVNNSSLLELFDKYNSISNFNQSRLKVMHLAKELKDYGHTI